VKKNATARALFALCRVVVVGDTCISEEGMATIVERDKRYHVCGSAHGSYDAGELIRKHQPDVLLIDPFLEDRDGIRWIKDLATEHPRIRILIGCQGSGWGRYQHRHGLRWRTQCVWESTLFSFYGQYSCLQDAGDLQIQVYGRSRQRHKGRG